MPTLVFYPDFRPMGQEPMPEIYYGPKEHRTCPPLGLGEMLHWVQIYPGDTWAVTCPKCGIELELQLVVRNG